MLYMSVITLVTNLYPVGQEYQGFHQLSDTWPHSLIGQAQLARGDDCWIVPVVSDCSELRVELNVLFLLPPVQQRYYVMLFKSNIKVHYHAIEKIHSTKGRKG
jgi:hypothetical protein